jgi:ABC-type sugar transport system ATPase subunit
MVGLEDYAARATSALSGGQQQRVALARALVIRPRVLLFDEPLSNLDAKLRKRVREDIRELQQRLGITSVYVTHDQEEALAISDRVVVMNQGVIEQIGSPHELYTRARDALRGGLHRLGQLPAGRYDGREIDVLGYRARTSRRSPSGPVTVMVRPESIEFAREGEDGFEATYLSSAYLGPVTEFIFDVGGQEVFATISGGGVSRASAATACACASRRWACRCFRPAERRFESESGRTRGLGLRSPWISTSTTPCSSSPATSTAASPPSATPPTICRRCTPSRSSTARARTIPPSPR